MGHRSKNKFKTALSGACAFLACTAVFAFFGYTTVWAGDINAEEQRIINFYNQTFTYNGKTYVATEAAKASAYNKLMADDVDLTKGQVDSMILQAKSNIATGIAEGYLVEVVTNTETATESGTESTESAANTESTQSTEKTEQSSESAEQTGTEKPGHTEKTEESGGSTEDGETGTETAVTEATEVTSGTGETGGPEDGTEHKGQNGQNESGGLVDKGENGEEDDPLIKIDINQFIDDLVNEGDGYVSVIDQNGETAGTGAGIFKQAAESDLFTVQQYSSGKVTMLKSDGTVLYQSSLPVKNTGYATVRRFLIPVVVIIGLGVLMVLAYKFRHKKNTWLVLPAAFTVIAALALAVGGKGTLEACMADWKTVWIAGAPQYDYSQEALAYIDKEEAGIGKPLRGSQYGEIVCEKLELKAPLYYGDDDASLEIGAGTYSGGFLPGENGTILIGGHDTTYFAPLAQIAEGDVLTIHTSYGDYQYKVTAVQIADVTDQTAYEIKGGGADDTIDDEELILYTCYPFGDTETLRNQRFFVYAQRIEQSESGE